AASGVGPLSGGVVALLITNEKLTELGMTSLVVVPVLVYAFQGIVGMPISTFFMKKYGHLFMTGQVNAKDTAKTALKEEPVKYKFMENNILKLFFVFLLAAVGVFLGDITGIHFTIFCLVLGILALNFGFFPKSVLESANSFSFMMVALIFVIIGTMADVTPMDVVDNIPSV